MSNINNRKDIKKSKRKRKSMVISSYHHRHKTKNAEWKIQAGNNLRDSLLMLSFIIAVCGEKSWINLEWNLRNGHCKNPKETAWPQHSVKSDGTIPSWQLDS